MHRRTTPQNGMREVHTAGSFFQGCDSDASVGRESIADTAGAGAHSAPVRWSCGSRRQTHVSEAAPRGPPFSQGGREVSEKPTEPTHYGPSDTCSSSHARMCYTTCTGELRRKMACEKCIRQDPFSKGAIPTHPSVANPSPTQPERGRILHPPGAPTPHKATALRRRCRSAPPVPRPWHTASRCRPGRGYGGSRPGGCGL